MLVDIGDGTWVAPDAIEAIEWAPDSLVLDSGHPRIFLKSGGAVYAHDWHASVERPPAETVQALVEHMARAVRRSQAARWGYPVNDPATGTDSEGTTT